MSLKRRSTVVAAAVIAAAACGVTSAPASASDATLKAQIEEVLPQVTPTVESFAETAKKAESSGDVSDLKLATVKVRRAISLYKWSVINRKADSGRGIESKKLLLTAIREYDIGFAAYATALEKSTSGASKASTIKSLKSFAGRIAEASKDEANALESFGIS